MSLLDLVGLFVLASGWGPTFLLIKLGVEEMSPLVLTSIRVFSGMTFLVAYCLCTGRSIKLLFPHWKDFLVMGIIGSAIPFTFCAWAETMVQSSTAGIIEGSVPVLTALLSAIFTRHRKIPKEQIVGIVMGFLGILIIFAPDILFANSGSEEKFFGKILLMGMSLSFAASFIFSKERLEHLPHVAGVALQLFFASLIIIPISLYFEGWQAFANVGGEGMWIAVLLGTFGTAFPWCVYFYLIKRGSATQVSLAVYLLPVVAIILGWVFLDETLHWNLALGTAVILFSLVLAGGMVSKRKITEHDNPLLRS